MSCGTTSWKTWLNNLSQKAASTGGTCNRVWSCSMFHLPWWTAWQPDFGKKACETWWIHEIEKESSWFRCYSSVSGTGSRMSPESIYVSISPLHKSSHLWCLNVLQESTPSFTTAPSWLICRKKTESLDFSLNPHAVQWSPSFRPWFPLLLLELWGESLEAR